MRNDQHVEQSFDGVSERVSRALASRVPRRSFFAGIGKGGIALAMGGAGAGLFASESQAHSNPCQYQSSVDCYQYWGYNECPPNTCGCGYWHVCDSTRCTYHKVWSDCCWSGGECNAGCIAGHPSCINHKEYTQGCGTRLSSHIKCRRWYCVWGPGCQ